MNIYSFQYVIYIYHFVLFKNLFCLYECNYTSMKIEVFEPINLRENFPNMTYNLILNAKIYSKFSQM